MMNLSTIPVVHHHYVLLFSASVGGKRLELYV